MCAYKSSRRVRLDLVRVCQAFERSDDSVTQPGNDLGRLKDLVAICYIVIVSLRLNRTFWKHVKNEAQDVQMRVIRISRRILRHTRTRI